MPDQDGFAIGEAGARFHDGKSAKFSVTPREPVPMPVARLRVLLDEQGGRRRLLEAVEDRLGSALCLDDQQLLLRAGALLEDERLALAL